jgi:two-component system, OmpR family, sensor histidine kinase BaeS
VNPFSRLSLRARLIIALVGVALLAADLSTLFSTLGLNARVSAAAHARVRRSGVHFTDVAATVYHDNRGWTPGAVTSLRHLAEMDGLQLTLYGPDKQVLVRPGTGPTVEPGATATGLVRVGGRTVGSLAVAPVDGRFLSVEETQLRHELSHLHLVAGATSVAIAFVAALYLGITLARPLRRIRATAERVATGDLAARVELSGEPEVRSVGRALNRLTETLQREEELRKENLADLAHELRTPVMGVLSRIEAAQDGVMNDEKANLAAMHDETTRLVRLLDDLSALAEAERPGLLRQKSRLDLAEIAAAQIDAIAPQSAAKDLRIRTELQSVWMEGDRDRLQQVVANLLSNAVRYTSSGGRVVVRVFGQRQDAILEVSDTGSGIAEDDLPHIFTRFWRGEKSRSRATGGAGIGLAIVAELVRAHDGSIEVDSTVGAGSTFRVHFPRLAA